MYQDFSSWPAEQERTFAVFEQHTVESGKKAWVFGGASAVGAFVLTILILVAFPPEKSHSEAAAAEPGVEDTMASEREAPAPAPAPAPVEETPTEAAPEGAEGAATEGAEGAATEGAATEGAATEGAAPAEGSGAVPGKKLSPTELIGK